MFVMYDSADDSGNDMLYDGTESAPRRRHFSQSAHGVVPGPYRSFNLSPFCFFLTEQTKYAHRVLKEEFNIPYSRLAWEVSFVVFVIRIFFSLTSTAQCIQTGSSASRIRTMTTQV